MRNQKGITLIALLITIIVLLILAEVSIAMLTGATNASADTKVAEAKEIAGLDVSDLVSEYYEKKYVNGTATEANAGEYVKTNLTSSDETKYTHTANSATITIVPKDRSGATVTGTIQDDGTIDW